MVYEVLFYARKCQDHFICTETHFLARLLGRWTSSSLTPHSLTACLSTSLVSLSTLLYSLRIRESLTLVLREGISVDLLPLASHLDDWAKGSACFYPATVSVVLASAFVDGVTDCSLFVH